MLTTFKPLNCEVQIRFLNMKILFHMDILLLLFTVPKIHADNIYKHSKNPSYFMQMLRPSDDIKNQFASNNTRINDHSDASVTPSPHVKKQNVNRFSQKQYEVINMLWRKTKIFVDIEATTVTYRSQRKTIPKKFYSITKYENPLQISVSRPISQISTPSYIEFYYIHEIDDRVKEKKSPSINIDIRIAGKPALKNNTQLVANKTMYGLSNYYRRTVVTPYQQFTHNNFRLKENSNLIFYVDFFTHKIATLFNKTNTKEAKAAIKSKYHQEKVTSVDMLFGNETCPYTTLQDEEVSSKSKDMAINMFRHTQPNQLHNNIKAPIENKITYEKLLLEHVDQNTRLDYGSENKTKHFKKHIDVAARHTNDIQNKHLKQDSKLMVPYNVKLNDNMESLNISPINELNTQFGNSKSSYNYVNRSVSWSEYRFVAVYVYEPLQVHCDAAGISSHWLITAGSCLARHHKNPGGDGLSAYVTYCGDDWWNPERISYVKHSLVHPRYHPRNRIRRHLYNIGIIQVVNSMASACPGWSPISLMSHHFSSNGIGTRATAVGWGLDRYDARYTLTDLPKTPLMMYDALLYSDSCPGNIGYSKAKQLEDEGGVRNVYCLALPPYNGEEYDPIHGSLLLVGEKLIALYLQEERRPWGDQCAIYTGTWRLLPWVLDNARESDESDIFTVDI